MKSKLPAKPRLRRLRLRDIDRELAERVAVLEMENALLRSQRDSIQRIADRRLQMILGFDGAEEDAAPGLL